MDLRNPNRISHATSASRSHHGGREDCWSDGATEALIEAWGDRYVLLNRGNLRQKDWMEVSDAVNSRQNGIKPQKTDIQCKNRMDTLKKKYKLEKSKLPPSKWRFYRRLDSLIGLNVGSSTTSGRKAGTATLMVKSSPKSIPNQGPNFSGFYSGGSSGPNSTDSSLGDGDDDVEDEDDDQGLGFGGRSTKKHKMEAVDFSDGVVFRELARAILKFGEVYEKMESSKQQQLMELEKQRMEFTKEIESQKMNMFMDFQVEVEKLKRSKSTISSTGKEL